MPDPLPPTLASAEIPAPILSVLRRLGEAGHRSWIVGGAVRDLLLGRPRHEDADFDLATPATPPQVMRLFRRTIPTGIEHGTVTVLEGGHHVEVTTFRGEGEYVDGRRPASVTFHSDLDADLARRDFTMNALAYDPLARELRDPFGGQADLAARSIRAVGDPSARFAEDGLRPLRGARFAAQLGFALDAATQTAIQGSLAVTAKVSAERVSEELTKLLLAPHAARGIALLDSTGLLSVVLPELSSVAPGLRAHLLDAAAVAPPSLAVKLAALLHALPADRARSALARLRFAGQVVQDAGTLVALHGCLLAKTVEAPATPADARRWLSRAGRLADDLLALWRADARSLPPAARRDARATLRGATSTILRARAEGPPLATSDLALDGRAVMALLGVPPGPLVGEALRHLLDLVLEEPRRNDRPSLERALHDWWAARGRT